jgi:hypothetical protein
MAGAEALLVRVDQPPQLLRALRLLQLRGQLRGAERRRRALAALATPCSDACSLGGAAAAPAALLLLPLLLLLLLLLMLMLLMLLMLLMPGAPAAVPGLQVQDPQVVAVPCACLWPLLLFPLLSAPAAPGVLRQLLLWRLIRCPGFAAALVPLACACSCILSLGPGGFLQPSRVVLIPLLLPLLVPLALPPPLI